MWRDFKEERERGYYGSQLLRDSLRLSQFCMTFLSCGEKGEKSLHSTERLQRMSLVKSLVPV